MHQAFSKIIKKTPLLAAEGFLILVIQIQRQFHTLNQQSIRLCLTCWGALPDLLGAEA